MSREQPQPIKNRDLFPVSGDFTGEPVAQQGAALMQAAEARVMGQKQSGATGITIGEALEATSHAAVNKPVEKSDAAAIQAAEIRATGSNVVTPGGISDGAQAAVSYNESEPLRDEDKIKLGHVLTGATVKLAADKVATMEDAEGVIGAELRNNPTLATHPGGVAASLAAAATMNEAQTS